MSASRKMIWAGRIISALPVLGLLMSAVMKYMKPPEDLEEFVRLGYAEGHALGLAIVELTCTVLYVIPQTAVLGAILLTGYLGGATATHVRISDPFIAPVIVGALVWLGLYLREPRLREILPWRRLSEP